MISESGSYLNPDDTCVFYQFKGVNKVEVVLAKEFSTLCKWFVENKLSIHFGEDKTKFLLYIIPCCRTFR